MKKITLYLWMSMLLLSGCTQVVTAPIAIAGAVACTTIDVAGSITRAVVCSENRHDIIDYY